MVGSGSRREVRALERLVRSLCAEVELVAERNLQNDRRCACHETALQIEAFEERRREALAALQPRDEPAMFRIGRLKRVAEALSCSRDFFRSAV
jgi:hypothetical protein